MPAVHLADAAERGGARVWLYELCWGFGPQGASHGLDTLLVFGTADIDGEVSAAGPAAVAAGRAAVERHARRARSRSPPPAIPAGPGTERPNEPRASTPPSATLVPTPKSRSRALWSDLDSLRGR